MIEIKAFEVAATSGTGVTLAQGEKGGLPYWRVGINKAAQEALFGRAIDPDKDSLHLAVDPAPKARHLLLLEVKSVSDPGGVPLEKSMKGAVGCKVAPWADVATGKRPACGLPIIAARRPGDTYAKVKLPDWARPALPKPHQGKGIMDD